MEKLSLDKLVKQTQTIDKLLERSFRLHRDGDRVPFVIQSGATFVVGATTASEMVFNVPTDADFEAEYFNLYLESRILSLDPSQRPSEKTYRPADWFHASSPFMVAATAGCLFDLRDSVNGAYQNVAIAIPSAFSAAVTSPIGKFNTGIPQYPGALCFHEPYQLKRGSTFTCRITPVQTNSLIPTYDTDVRAGNTFEGVTLQSYETVEFQVRGLLHGYKRTFGFR